MIRIDLIWAVAGLLGAVTIVVFIVWAFYSLNEDSRTLYGKGENIEQCSYCTYVFFNAEHEALAQCPRCRSFLTRASRPATSHEGEVL